MSAAEVLGIREVLSPKKEKYAEGLKAAEKSFEEALEIFSSTDFDSKEGWKIETKTSDHESVYSKHIPEGKLFALQCELPGDVETIFWDQWNEFAKTADWNSNLAFTKVVTTLSDHVDVIHYGNPDILVVKGRDFVVARMYRKLDSGGYMIAAKSFDYPGIPEIKELVRGELMMGAGQFLPKEGNPDVTIVKYIMCIDLKGYIPKFIVNQFMAKLMLNDVAANKKHAAELMARK